jgi:hypothetical protein
VIGSLIGTALGWLLLGAMLLHLRQRERAGRDIERAAADLRAELRELEAECARLEHLLEQRLTSTQWDPHVPTVQA